MSKYSQLIEHIFFRYYDGNATVVEFEREDLVNGANTLGIEVPKNLGDVIYSVRYRAGLPKSIRETAKEGHEWIIFGRGIAKYEFRLVRANLIVPNANLLVVKIPDATPEIVNANALSDEQALLAKIRYNRVLDIFLGLATYSLQNHLRTTVRGIGQIEIDELYVGVDRFGRQFVFPVQAKGGNDKLSVVQTMQDIAYCEERFPSLICRSVSAQFMGGDQLAIFELAGLDGEIAVVQEKHFRLVASSEISDEDLAICTRHASDPG